MDRRKSEAKVSIPDKIHDDNLPPETRAAQIDVSKSMIVDAAENSILAQSEDEVQTIEEAEKGNDVTLVGCSNVEKNTIDAAEDEDEDEYIHEEHNAEKVEMEIGEAKGEEELDDYDDDDDGDDVDVNEYDSDDDDDFGEGEEGLDDYDDDDGDHVDFEDDNDDEEEEDEDDDDGDDENDYLMEEEEIDEIIKSENNDNTVEESDESQRNIVAQEKEEENSKEEHQERGGGSLKTYEKTLRKWKQRKKVTKEVSDKVASKCKDKQEEDVKGDAMEESDQENAKEDVKGKEGSSKQKVKGLRKRRRKATAEGSEKVASKRNDKVKSLCRKKVKSMGMIFMCSSKTKKDCYHYKVLGLPANKKDVVGKIYKGMRLFLYDVDLKLLYGIYKAAGPGGYNIQPRAFNSQFPSQVRFTVLEDCLPLAEEKFKKVIKDNYFTKTKFDCQLTSQQVKNLCKLFVSASKGSTAIRSSRRKKTHASTDRDRSRARGGERRSAAMAEKRRYHEHSCNHEREVVASPVALVSQRLLPPAAVTPSYAYERALELDDYRGDWVVEQHDSYRHPVPGPRLGHRIVYRRDPLLHQLDSYRRDVAVEHQDLRLRDEIGRVDPYIPYRERAEHRDLRSRDDFGRHHPYFSYRGSTEDHNLRARDELRRRDPYISIRGLPAHRDRLYDADPLPEQERYGPINRSEYPFAVDPLPEYRSAPSLYRYYKY